MVCSVAEPRAKGGLLPRRAFCDVAYDSNTHNAFLKRFPGFSIRWFSYCSRNFWVSKSSRICCSVADMSSALFFLLSLSAAKSSPWRSLLFAFALLRRRSACHSFWLRSASFCAVRVLGCCCLSTIHRNNALCHIMKSSSILSNICSSTCRGGSSNLGM